MTEQMMDKIVWWVRLGGNVLFYGIVLAFILSCAALLSYLEPMKGLLR